ncbi:MAG TPA: peptide chain release factor N(5)-glutamine methyltransferase [Rhodospirillaceae bacterium]|mgnify:CR=1 FL=1|nr:protein-(glutamine-N5) methyltransferase, release factor-specific [Rhodospirillaceae bacterium]HAA93062.1 peptide chain release factor N(5)-glutamine methyltransferase [Rhodospirillaceae bacterium]HAT35826.1 peptide chain release factor N(5)-glutamine methyltransferase [Rhodospirillaceae bacterium]
MTMPTRLDRCLDEAAHKLATSGIEAPRREARLLMGHCLGRDPAQLLGPQAETVSESEQYFSLVDRRARHEPLSYILGRREFWSLEFEVGPDVLDPRPDSEILVETALRFWPEAPATARVLDLGTGSGCLLLSLLHERRQASGVGIDFSSAALEIAKRNAASLGLGDRTIFLQGDWARGIGDRFDIILANPPYIASDEIDDLEPEVAVFEPLLALDGGADGLDAYRRLAPELMRLTAPSGKTFLEIGVGQMESVTRILEGSGMEVFSTSKDLAGHTRCLAAQPRKRS